MLPTGLVKSARIYQGLCNYNQRFNASLYSENKITHDTYALLDTIDELKIELERNNYNEHDIMGCCRVCIYCSFDYTVKYKI